MGKTLMGKPHLAVTGIALLALTGCMDTQSADQAAVEIRGTAPGAAAPAPSSIPQPSNPVPGPTGIVAYDGYYAAVARNGDTVASVADRIGLSATELGAYNGLQAGHPLRAGDELVLPSRPGGYDAGPAPQQLAQATVPSATAPSATAPSATVPSAAATDAGTAGVTAIELAPLTTPAPAASAAEEDNLTFAQDGTVAQPTMDVQGQARPQTAAAPAAETGTGAAWSPDLAAAAIDRAATPGSQSTLPPPPSASQPLPPEPAKPGTLTSPGLSQYQTPVQTPDTAPAAQPTTEGQVQIGSFLAETKAEPEQVPQPAPEPEPEPVIAPVPVPEPKPMILAEPKPAQEPVDLAMAAPETGDMPTPPAPRPQQAAPAAEPAPAPSAPVPAPVPQVEQPNYALKLIPPVRGPIVIGFGQGGRGGNDGVDFAAPAGSPVLAAASGEVALVSRSLGGLGTIVLVRHPDDYLTVYGRIERVTVAKGDLVQRGDQIGSVAATNRPRMHFEVRQGAESLNPERFF